jgi:hypothetical protein
MHSSMRARCIGAVIHQWVFIVYVLVESCVSGPDLDRNIMGPSLVEPAPASEYCGSPSSMGAGWIQQRPQLPPKSPRLLLPALLAAFVLVKREHVPCLDLLPSRSSRGNMCHAWIHWSWWGKGERSHWFSRGTRGSTFYGTRWGSC